MVFMLNKLKREHLLDRKLRHHHNLGFSGRAEMYIHSPMEWHCGITHAAVSFQEILRPDSPLSLRSRAGNAAHRVC